jgi:hypothetical protein
MKVYSLEACYSHEGCSLEGVFLTREEAEAKKAELDMSPDKWEIKEWELGERRGPDHG